MTSTSILYDLPGPRARARHRLYAVVGVALALASLAYVAQTLWQQGQITPDAWRFLKDPDILLALARGLGATLTAAVIAILLAIAFGAVFAVGEIAQRPLVRWPATAVVQFLRAVPVLLMMLTLYLTLGRALGTYWCVVLALTLYNGAVLAEVFRAGILAVPRGQREAGYALGLRRGQVLRLIQIPQAVTSMLPAIISQCVIALKDTALGFVIGAPELTRAAKSIYTSITYNNPIAVGLLMLTIFVSINFSLSLVAQKLEGRRKRRRQAAHDRPHSPTSTIA